MVGNIQEVKARGGSVIALTTRRQRRHQAADRPRSGLPDHRAGVAPAADARAHGRSAAAARVPHRDPPRLRRRSAAEPGEERDRRVAYADDRGSAPQGLVAAGPDGGGPADPDDPPCANAVCRRTALCLHREGTPAVWRGCADDHLELSVGRGPHPVLRPGLLRSVRAGPQAVRRRYPQLPTGQSDRHLAIRARRGAPRQAVFGLPQRRPVRRRAGPAVAGSEFRRGDRRDAHARGRLRNARAGRLRPPLRSPPGRRPVRRGGRSLPRDGRVDDDPELSFRRGVRGGGSGAVDLRHGPPRHPVSPPRHAASSSRARCCSGPGGRTAASRRGCAT